jgi:hypothetical protein
LIGGGGLNRFERMVPALFRYNIVYVLPQGMRCVGALIFGRGEEVLGKVVSRICGCLPGTRTPSNGYGPEHESEKAEDRNGKEDIHAP